MTTWKPGLRVRSYAGQDLGTVVWVGRSKRGAVRVGVRPDGSAGVQFFSPGRTLWGSWIEAKEEA
jgi:hypothetical protein